jgi:predicted alpha/beta superfamily hydrolase
MRAVFLLLILGCGSDQAPSPANPDGADPTPDGANGCAPGKAGAACVLALHDRAVDGCDATIVDELRTELDARANLGPLWADGRALFRTAAPRGIAGTFNDWNASALRSAALCETDLVVAVGAVATGHHAYKLVDGDTWSLDPANPGFAYDDFSGNPDGKNSAFATPDSGRGYLVELGEACSNALGNCRAITAYLPPGYDALEHATRTYPVLFMHDGQNVFDDHDCCFGHTGWELNVALDREIADGEVAPLVVIAAAHSAARNTEYGLSPETMAAFMAFQVSELQPAALAKVRWNGERVAVGGSSLGGLVAMHLALAYPEVYAVGVSLSGAFWPGQGNGTALRDLLPGIGKQPVAVYLDHGGQVGDNSDGAADSVEVRDVMFALGWQRTCGSGPSALCYHHEPGATHDELAWKDRAWRFLRFVSPR